jgi:hypothetical protein
LGGVLGKIKKQKYVVIEGSEVKRWRGDRWGRGGGGAEDGKK